MSFKLKESIAKELVHFALSDDIRLLKEELHSRKEMNDTDREVDLAVIDSMTYLLKDLKDIEYVSSDPTGVSLDWECLGSIVRTYYREQVADLWLVLKENENNNCELTIQQIEDYQQTIRHVKYLFNKWWGETL